MDGFIGTQKSHLKRAILVYINCSIESHDIATWDDATGGVFFGAIFFQNVKNKYFKRNILSKYSHFPENNGQNLKSFIMFQFHNILFT